MTKIKDGVVIIGAGHAGSQAAASLRQEGYAGPITIFSDEADIPYHKPPLSKGFLKTPEMKSQLLRAAGVYADNGIELRLDTPVTEIDAGGQRVIVRCGSPIRFAHLVLATGARARRLAITGADLQGVFYLRSIADARALRDAIPSAGSAAVIGGGFIGLETAASLASIGKHVTVIEAADRLLGRAVAPIVSDHVANFHRSLGVRLLTGASVKLIEGDTNVSAIVTTGGERIDTDIVIIGIGAEPNVELARQAGVACNDGIVVDSCFQTSLPGIHAIGDCAAYDHWQAGRRIRIESVQNATDHARHVARSILGRHDGYREVPWFWSDQGNMKLQMAGLAAGADRQIVSGSPEANAFSVYHFLGDRLLAVDSINRPADHMLGRKMLAKGFSPSEKLIADGASTIKTALAALG